MAEFARVIADAAAADPWLRDHPPAVEWFSGQFAPAEVATDSPVARLVAAAHRTATGCEIAYDAATYGADMRHFVNTAGLPCVMYGAGDVRLAHYTDEFVPLDEVMTVARTLALAIVDWCG
jgi:acetylornithine deacetylase